MTTNRILHVMAVLCVAAVAVALVSQHVFDMRPCAWCVLQRLVFLAIAAVCWLGVLAGRVAPGLRRFAGLLAALLGAGGMVAAWYQYSVAAQRFSCDMTFADRFMVASGLDAGVPWLFGIFASCLDARVELLGVEYALWGMGLFALLTVMALVAAARRSGRRR
ncbi:MAG: disulfide bond formation protein B [Alcaligenaceae bacterium]|nr:disulfide bond formation protein B [Alcaligenaceae bacterium]